VKTDGRGKARPQIRRRRLQTWPKLLNFDGKAAAAAIGPLLPWRRAPVQVLVRDNNVDQALRALKKKMQREGVFREMKLRRNYEKPSERRARERAEAIRRYRKLLRKRLEREGY
jgi:small subunit ribosomal protein S21